MQDITDGKINCVIVKDLSRLGREYIETGRYLRRVFPTYGVRFIAITDNIDTAHEGSGDDLTVSVKNIMNESLPLRVSQKRQWQNGTEPGNRCCGTAHFPTCRNRNWSSSRYQGTL